ncbi:MAG: glycosyltransferase family 39 protein [Pirellulales bacterium]|nr:glycosyltransferase family 39 protein [Pirellulales bacterium]
MRLHWIHLGALVLLSLGVQAWLLSQAATPAQDVVRVVELAQRLNQEGRAALGGEDEAAAAALLATAHVARVRALAADPNDWARTAQALAGMAVVLASVPLYALLVQLTSPRVALAGCAVMTASGTIPLLGADGQADAVHLCLALTALSAIISGLGAGGGRALGFAGLVAGVATQLRTEAWLIPPIAVAAAALLPAANWPARGQRLARVALAVGLACVVAHAATAWALGSEGSAVRLILQLSVHQQPPRARQVDRVHQQEADHQAMALRLPSGEPLALDDKERSDSRRAFGARMALAELAQELPAATGIPALLLGVAGIAIGRRNIRTALVWPFCAALTGVTLAAAAYVATRAGYLSARHLVLLAVPTALFAGLGAVALVDLTAQRSARLKVSVVAAVAASMAAPLLVAHPHASRGAHRAAGEWLRALPTSGSVLDTRGWTLLYSGRPTYRFDRAATALSDPRLRYLVVERRELVLDSARSRTLAWLVATMGRQVASFPLPHAAPTKTVEIYALYPERLAALDGVVRP